MRELSRRYFSGEIIPAGDFKTSRDLYFFGDVIFEDWKKERTVAQQGLDRELYWRKVKPTIKKEEKHEP